MATGKANRKAFSGEENGHAGAQPEMNFEVSSGNVYADLGFEDAEEMAAKARLVREVRRTMERQGLTQVQVSSLTGVDQPTLSKLLRGRLSNFTLDRLTEMLRDLGRNVVLVVEEEPTSSEKEGAVVKPEKGRKPLPKGHMKVAVIATGKLGDGLDHASF